ncbi:unnamed protein product, partial [Ectocarpus fasciculatus]
SRTTSSRRTHPLPHPSVVVDVVVEEAVAEAAAAPSLTTTPRRTNPLTNPLTRLSVVVEVPAMAAAAVTMAVKPKATTNYRTSSAGRETSTTSSCSRASSGGAPTASQEWSLPWARSAVRPAAGTAEVWAATSAARPRTAAAPRSWTTGPRAQRRERLLATSTARSTARADATQRQHQPWLWLKRGLSIAEMPTACIDRRIVRRLAAVVLPSLCSYRVL